jgi:hypothetical protein
MSAPRAPRARRISPFPGGGSSMVPAYPGRPVTESNASVVTDDNRFGKIRSIPGNLTANQELKVISEGAYNRSFLLLRCVSGSIGLAVEGGSNSNTCLTVLPAGGYILFDSFVPQNDIYVKEVAGAAASYVLSFALRE